MESPAPAAPEAATPARVTLLVPLSGRHAAIGGAMQNAAQLALFDLGNPNFELTFKDTGSTPAGSARAAKEALREGTGLILGPIFADEVRAARDVLKGSPVSLIGFSTDTTVAGPGSYVMGILPQDQARQAASFAASRGAKRALIVAGNDPYSRIVSSSFTFEAQRHGMTIVGVLPADGPDEALQTALSPYVNGPLAGPASRTVEAIFVPLPADRAARVMAALNRLGTPRTVLRLGTGLWDEAGQGLPPELNGAFYPAPTPESRKRFETLYQTTYKQTPPRIASLAYDASALAITLARNGNGAAGLTENHLTGTGGFLGIDGLFRLRPEGITERKLAILQIQPGRRVVVHPAQTRFETD